MSVAKERYVPFRDNQEGLYRGGLQAFSEAIPVS
jgi:hypothetical protein